MENNIEKQQIEDDEIDLTAIAKTIWNGRKTIIKSTIICTIIGLFIAIFSPKEYTATTTFIPQVSDGKGMGGSLGGLAAMAGINLGSMGGNADISPTLYPQIIASTDFCKEIMEMELSLDGFEQPITFYDYFTEQKKLSVIEFIKLYTIGLPGLIKKAILDDDNNTAITNTSNFTKLTKEEYALQKLIPEIIFVLVDEEKNIVTLSGVMHEATAAAVLTYKAQELLQKYVTLYKIKKAQKEFLFIEERFSEQKLEFEKSQNILAEYTDKNKNVTSAKAQSEYERLRSDYQLKTNIYSELAKQLEQAKLKVAEDTPSFSIIQQVVLPMEKSAPRRGFIVAVSIFLGGIIGISIVFTTNIWLSKMQ